MRHFGVDYLLPVILLPLISSLIILRPLLPGIIRYVVLGTFSFTFSLVKAATLSWVNSSRVISARII